MGLNIVSQGGNFDPWVKYNGKAGRFYKKGPNGEEVEVINPVFVADFDNIKTGWIYFAAGTAPDRVWDASLSQPAPKPSENHKRGFSLRLFSNAHFDGVGELSSSSMHLCSAVNDLYTAFEAGRAQNPGMLPVVKYTGSTPMKDKKGTNYRPNFIIEKWVARPAEFDADASNENTQQAAAQPAPAPVSSVSEF